jgi:CRISPR-associated endonuclease/helicase Cas3
MLMMMSDHSFLKLWGKTDRGPGAALNNYHPLLFHLYDVAYCAAELWKVLPISIKMRLAQALDINDVNIERAGTLFVLLSGLHDLGKAYPNFQNKAPQFVPDLQSIGFDFPADIGIYPHNFVSVPEVRRLFAEARLFPQQLTPELALLFAYTLGAHHGIFPQAADLTNIQGRALGENPTWEDARNWLAEQLKLAIPNVEEAMPSPNLTVVSDRAFVPLLAAFISLADWFGSSKHFAMQGAQGVAPYMQHSRKSAANALQKSGWTVTPASPIAVDFAQMFAYLDRSKSITPNHLQAKVAVLLEGIHTPALWMIEEEMGAGKTETAFSIFDHARIHDIAHGTYIAMPTQATSNAMFTRLGDFLRHRAPQEEKEINLILAHSHAMLDDEYRRRMEIAETFTSPVYNQETREEDGALLVRSWFTQNKQTLLAHYGVGTIDQALMGVLQTRHWFVRLFGLARKVVIFDEVHAYDAYMNTLLSRLIEWLAELDCTVVLLSATLPKATRLTLANAYAKGAKARLSDPDNQTCYPRITLVPKGAAESARAITIVKDPQPEPKKIALLHRPNTPEAVKSALLDAIPGDGCAIVICNTVADAQNMFEALKAELKCQGWNCLLFHARTPFIWRKETEECILELFGKHSGNERTIPRAKTLLVATQVAEQSLDLDADFMASEIAPVDLILQRMGRLYRHNRARASVGPRFALLYDLDASTGLPHFGMSEYVYALHTLLRSWLALRDLPEIVLPTDIEPLVTAVYDLPDPTGLEEVLTQVLSAAKADFEQKRKEQRQHARAVSVRIQEEEATFLDWIHDLKPTLLDDDDPEIHMTLRALTRDGDPSLTLVLCGTDENGDTLALDPAGNITPEVARQMMSFSLPTSQKSIYHALKSEKPPTNWLKNAHLKHCRRLVLKNGVTTVGNRRVTLTRELGLQIESDRKE